VIKAALFMIVLHFNFTLEDFEPTDFQILVERLLILFSMGILGLNMPLLFVLVVRWKHLDIIARVGFHLIRDKLIINNTLNQ
jgi:hypothetical protein